MKIREPFLAIRVYKKMLLLKHKKKEFELNDSLFLSCQKNSIL